MENKSDDGVCFRRIPTRSISSTPSRKWTLDNGMYSEYFSGTYMFYFCPWSDNSRCFTIQHQNIEEGMRSSTAKMEYPEPICPHAFRGRFCMWRKHDLFMKSDRIYGVFNLLQFMKYLLPHFSLLCADCSGHEEKGVKKPAELLDLPNSEVSPWNNMNRNVLSHIRQIVETKW